MATLPKRVGRSQSKAKNSESPKMIFSPKKRPTLVFSLNKTPRGGRVSKKAMPKR